MKPDPLDAGFIDRLHSMLGMDKDEATEKVEGLDGQQMIDLSDAVASGDEAAARTILSDANDGEEQVEGDVEDEKDINPLFAPDKENVEDDEEIGVDDEPLPDDDDGPQFDVGDKVKVGKDEGVVEVPDGPSHTVGVRINGKMRMIDRSKVKHLNESVLGMIGIPDITRMRELAGLGGMSPEVSMPAAEYPVPAFRPDTQVLDLDDEPETAVEPEDSAKRACTALDQLERDLPNVRLSDLSPIRRRINMLVTRLNEQARATPASRIAEVKRKPVVASKPVAAPVREGALPGKRKTLADYMKRR